MTIYTHTATATQKTHIRTPVCLPLATQIRSAVSELPTVSTLSKTLSL